MSVYEGEKEEEVHVKKNAVPASHEQSIQLRKMMNWINLTAATGAARLHTLTLADLHSGLVVDGGVTHALLDLAGHGKESLLDVAGVLGGGLEEGDAEAVCELLLGKKR